MSVTDERVVPAVGSGVARLTDRRVVTVAVVVVVWAWTVLPRLNQSLTAPKFRGSVGSDVAQDTPLTAHMTSVLTLSVAAISLLAIGVCARRPRPTPLAPLLVAMAPWLFLVLHDLPLYGIPTPRVLAYPLVVLAMWQLRPDRSTMAVLGYLIGLSAVLAILMGLLVPGKGLLQASGGGLVDEDKQVLPIGILVGFLTHGNSLGEFLGLGVPLVGAIRRPAHRWPLLAAVVLAVLWSASRTSILAMAATGAVAIALTSRQAGWRTLVAWLSCAGALVAMVFLPLVTTSPTAFTNRGFIWVQSLGWWQASPWTGLGSRYYSVVGGTSQRLAATVFHGHNEMIQFLVTGGLVLVGLGAVLVFALVLRAVRLATAGSAIGVLFLLSLLLTCTLEIPLTYVDNFGLFPVAVLPVMYLLFTDEARRADARLSPRTTAEPLPAVGGIQGNA